MSASTNADFDIALFRQDLVALKRDVASMTEHMKGGETTTVQTAAGEIEPPVRSLRQQAGGEVASRARRSVFSLRSRPSLC